MKEQFEGFYSTGNDIRRNTTKVSEVDAGLID